MVLPARRTDHEDAQHAEDRRTASLAGLAMALLLVVVGLMLVRVLHHESTVEDCLLAGRLDCDGMVQTAVDPPL